MLSKYYQILNIYNTVTPGHRANITGWLVCAPVVNNDAHVGRINNPIPIKVNNRLD